MTTQNFIALFQEAFGKKVQLPLLFGYSDKPIANTLPRWALLSNKKI